MTVHALPRLATRTAVAAPRRRRPWSIAPAIVAPALVAAAIGMVIAQGSYSAPPAGLPDPGAFVAWGTSVLRTLTDIAAVATVGWLLAAAFLDAASQSDDTVRAQRRDMACAGVSAAIWAVLATAQMVFDLANVRALSLSEAIRPEVIAGYVNEIPTTRALIMMAVLAVAVAVGALGARTAGASTAILVLAVSAASLPVFAGHSTGLGNRFLALAVAASHVLAAMVWMGGLMALAIHSLRADMPLAAAVKRFSTIALVSIILVALSGFGNAYARLDGAAQLLTTGYGLLILVKTGLIAGLAFLGWIMRRRIIGTLEYSSRFRAFACVATTELVILATAIGLGVALASSPAPSGLH